MKSKLIISSIIVFFITNFGIAQIHSNSTHQGTCEYGENATLNYVLSLEHSIKEYENGFKALIIRINDFKISKITYKNNVISNSIISIANPDLFIEFSDVYRNNITNKTYRDVHKKYPSTTNKFDFSKTNAGISGPAFEKIENPNLNNLDIILENLKIVGVNGGIDEVKNIIEKSIEIENLKNEARINKNESLEELKKKRNIYVQLEKIDQKSYKKEIEEIDRRIFELEKEKIDNDISNDEQAKENQNQNARNESNIKDYDNSNLKPSEQIRKEFREYNETQYKAKSQMLDGDFSGAAMTYANAGLATETYAAVGAQMLMNTIDIFKKAKQNKISSKSRSIQDNLEKIKIKDREFEEILKSNNVNRIIDKNIELFILESSSGTDIKYLSKNGYKEFSGVAAQLEKKTLSRNKLIYSINTDSLFNMVGEASSNEIYLFMNEIHFNEIRMLHNGVYPSFLKKQVNNSRNAKLIRTKRILDFNKDKKFLDDKFALLIYLSSELYQDIYYDNLLKLFTKSATNSDKKELVLASLNNILPDKEGSYGFYKLNSEKNDYYSMSGGYYDLNKLEKLIKTKSVNLNMDIGSFYQRYSSQKFIDYLKKLSKGCSDISSPLCSSDLNIIPMNFKIHQDYKKHKSWKNGNKSLYKWAKKNL